MIKINIIKSTNDEILRNGILTHNTGKAHSVSIVTDALLTNSELIIK